MINFIKKYSFDFTKLILISILVTLYLQTGKNGYINVLVFVSILFLIIDSCLIFVSGLSLFTINSKNFSIKDVNIEKDEIDYYIYLTKENSFYVVISIIHYLFITTVLVWFGHFWATSLVFIMLLSLILRTHLNSGINNFYVKNKEQLCSRK